MRVSFDLNEFEPLTFIADGEHYDFSLTHPLAKKENLSENICEYVYKLNAGKHILLTVTGEEGRDFANGITCGYYEVKSLTDAGSSELIAEFMAP